MPYCVECGFYTGLYEVGLERRNGKLGVYQRAKFQEGLCFCQDLLISDGFRERKCEYYEQISAGWFSSNQYIPLMKKRLLEKQLRHRILVFAGITGFVMVLSLILTLLSNLELISPPF